jgi:phospholipid/cholesterol/gamma-HCH transport system ATP-binding protein
MVDTMPIIEVQNLVARYGKNVVLDNLSFTVNPGEIFMIIGGSGCGKTTLLKHMFGLLSPFTGEVILEGQNISRISDKERIAILRKIGVLYQSGALFGSMDLLQNVALPLEELTELPKDAIGEIARNKLTMVGLEKFHDYLPAHLSGGMQKRAAIARAMVLDPKILFLDEPTSGLDPIISSEIDQLIVDLTQILGITFVIVSHDIASIYKIASRVILLYEGKIIANGSPQELQHSTDPLVKKFFESRKVA